MCDWGKCDTAIGQLETLLSCDICHHLVDNPCMLGGCEHCFCRSCISDQLGENCPVCNIPSHARDVQSNRQLANVVLMCKRFKRLLAQNTATQHEGGGELNSPKETKKKNKSHDLEESSHQPASVQKENLVPPVNKDPYAVYDFESSPMTTTSKPAGRRTRSVTAKNVKKKALAAVNKRWGIKQSPSEASFNDPCTSCKKTKEGREERKRRVQIITPTSSIKSKGHVSNINDTSIQGVSNCYNAAIDIAGGFVTGDDDKNKDAVDKCNVSNSAISSEKTATAATKANVLNEEISTDNDASVTIQTENDDHINHIQSGKYPGKSGEDKNRSHGGCGADSKHHKPECDEQDSEQGAVTVEELGLCATPTSAVHRSRRPRTLHHSENHRPKSGDRVHNRKLPTGTVLSPSPVTIRKTRRSAETNLSPAPTRKSRRSSETPPASIDSPGHTKTTRQSVEKQNIPAAQGRHM
ncbi:BRCA1-associated RING domain protein 1-like [Lingula anatina]|uniref:BRCA1-associated RING domain protein 1-like n=1 Tax=Lingula anatina TaxID=7574 RepID=A0A1S3HGW8_LINAN|nr:BRCA1-associated RING domain protein 1-like [Lingula anatina]|eukprot:XP_013384731.1 BRCA1-associated RING domain protein 1-like [Lingula anatina]